MLSKKNAAKQILVAIVSMVTLGLVLTGCGSAVTTVDTSVAVPTNTPNTFTTSAALPTVTPMSSTTTFATVTAEPTNTEATVANTTLAVSTTATATSTTVQAQPTFQKPIILTVGAITPPTAKRLPTPIPQPTLSGDKQAVNLTVAQAIELAKQTLNQESNKTVGTDNLASYFPDMPGTKLTNYNKCREQSQAGNIGTCGSDVSGTTAATNENGTWYIDFTLVWPGTIPQKMKISQAMHSWRLAVSPNGQATLLSESGATVPTF